MQEKKLETSNIDKETKKSFVDNLVQDQIGKTIVSIFHSGLHKDRVILDAFIESRFNWNEQNKEIKWRKIGQKLAVKCLDYPGIFPIISDKYKTCPIDNIFVPSLYWRRTTVNEDGSFPIYSNLLDTVDVTTDDFAQAEKLLLSFPNQAKDIGLSYTEHLRKEQEHVSNTIDKYKMGNKPTVHEVLNSRDLLSGSITEPLLQYGTPQEGLTYLIAHNSEPDKVIINLSEITTIEWQGNHFPKIGLALAEPNFLTSGRSSADRYYSFISHILEQDPEINEKIYEKTELSVKKYIDLEWQKKDEAIDIAQEINNVLDQRIQYWHQLIAKI